MTLTVGGVKILSVVGRGGIKVCFVRSGHVPAVVGIGAGSQDCAAAVSIIWGGRVVVVCGGGASVGVVAGQGSTRSRRGGHFQRGVGRWVVLLAGNNQGKGGTMSWEEKWFVFD